MVGCRQVVRHPPQQGRGVDDHLVGAVSRPLRYNLQPYSGVNVLLLWAEACARGCSAPIWMTFRQALELGPHVRKGETGSTVVCTNRMVGAEAGDDGQDVERHLPSLKADIRHGGGQAYYAICDDRVQMPPFESFVDAQSDYATLAHECTH